MRSFCQVPCSHDPLLKIVPNQYAAGHRNLLPSCGRRSLERGTVAGESVATGSIGAAGAPPEKARALLDQVKKSEQDRAIAAKQTEIDRLKEDQAKARATRRRSRRRWNQPRV
jgi:hypothetical protein